MNSLQQPNLRVFVGSTNPGKIASTRLALVEYGPEVVVTGVAAASGVSDQPMTDQDTRQGARQRAKAALETGLAQEAVKAAPAEVTSLGIGLEGGVMEEADGQLWMTVWVAVCDQAGEYYEANGIRVPVPSIIAERLRAGQEMGPAMDELMGQTNLKHETGMLGIITAGKINRVKAYAALAELALGQWAGKNWTDQIPAK